MTDELKAQMKQRSLGAGGSLQLRQPSSEVFKPKPVVKKKKYSAVDMKSTWLTPKTEAPEVEDVSVDGEQTWKPRPFICKIDDALMEWLRKYDTEGDDRMDQARDYLMRGPPFKGTHDKNYKSSIKEHGLEYIKNSEFVEGSFNGQKFGWWSAHDTKELKAVLTMARKHNGDRAWSPCDLDDIAMSFVDSLLEQYGEYKKEKEEKARQEEEERRKAKEKALGRGSGVYCEDLMVDIQSIAEYMKAGGYPDWEYDRALIASSAACAALGPMTPTHAIRVRRGLRFNLITPKQVHLGQWDTDATIAMRKREEAADANNKRQRDASNLESKEVEKRKALELRAKNAVQVLQRDDEMEVEKLPIDDYEQTRPSWMTDKCHLYVMVDTSLKDTACGECGVEIHEQFMDCGCTLRAWKKCVKCLSAYCDEQRCQCDAGEREIALAVLDAHIPVAEDVPAETGVEVPLSEKAQGKQKATSGGASQKSVRWEDD